MPQYIFYKNIFRVPRICQVYFTNVSKKISQFYHVNEPRPDEKKQNYLLLLLVFVETVSKQKVLVKTECLYRRLQTEG